MIERQTARKVRIADLMKGKWVKKEGMEPSFVVTPHGENVSRARLMGTVVAKFISEDESFGSLTIDDFTDTIRAKSFQTVKPLNGVEIGDLVDAIGKVKEYNEEIYIIPEVVSKIANPNMEILRKLEIMKKLKGKKQLPPEGDRRDNIKTEVLKFIESHPEGVEYNKVLETIKAEEKEIEAAIDDLLGEGICYEPTPGKIRKI
jgi:RPA family protein